MRVLAADTWGISGPSFLLLYGAVACAALGGAALWRRRLLGRGAGRGATSLSAYELAMLNGGVSLTTTAAVAELERDGVLQPGSRRHTLRARGRGKRHLVGLERAVVNAVGGKEDVSVRTVHARVSASPEARELRATLEHDGFLLSPRAARQVRLAALIGLPVLALGVVRLIAGIHNHKPVADLTFGTIVVLAITATMLLRRARMTSAGLQALRSRQSGQAHMRAHPDHIARPLAVALFGGSVLWTLAPSMAAAMSAPRVASRAWNGGYFGGTTGYFGGGGCGGGGGGGGCGGGGGGGCGG